MGTEQVRLSHCWICAFKFVGGEFRQIRTSIKHGEMMTRLYGAEVTDTTLPGKATKLQVYLNRTENRHRWSGREYSGA